MAGLLPKPAVSADRRPTPGLKPPNADKSARPASAESTRKWDAAPAAPVSDLDRSRRLSQSDPQGRYGNSEVARVAAKQNPAPLGARKAPAVKLPEAGTRAVGPKHKGGGHGAKSANPGAAKAAVEAKHKADQAKQDKGKVGPKAAPAEKEKPAAKDGAGAHADADHKASKEKGGDTKEGGGEAAGESGKLASAPADSYTATPPPPARPRLGGTEAEVLKVPTLGDQQRERMRLQTGLTVAEHYARAQVHLDRLSARATSEQFAIVVHIELIEAEVRRDLDNAMALIGPAIDSGVDRVRQACATARAAITTASTNAHASIADHWKDAGDKVDSAALSSKEAVDKAVKASSPQVRALHEETMKPIREMLKRQGEAFSAAAQAQGDELIKAGDKMAPDMKTVGGDDIELAIAEKKHTVASDNMTQAKDGFIAAGKRAEQDILAQEPSLSLSFLMFVNPVAVKVEHVGGADGKTVVEKGGEVRLRLATDHERATGFIDETSKRALKALDALEESGIKQLRAMRHSLEVMAQTRRDQLCSSILSGQEPAADAWTQQMRGVNDLVAGGEVVDSRRLEPRFVAAMDSMNALSARQRLDFDAQARSGFDEARAGLDQDRHSIDEVADSFVDSARDTQRQAVTMREFAGSLSKGFHSVADASAVTAEEFRTKAEEKLGLSVADTRKQMTELCKTTEDAIKESVKTFRDNIGGEAKRVEVNVKIMVMGVDAAVWFDLADRAGRCVKAMDRIGTDETGLFQALYAMTPQYGKALCQFWNQADHAHDLWWWLDDELSGDEYWTAYYYLKGDPVQGAAFQMKASIHWYGDDVTQIESGLRALTKDQLKELDTKYPVARQKLEANLKGTNLQVAQALLAGRTARADALRLKEGIDAARAKGDDDKVHDLLSQIDPERLPEVRTEFVDILNKNAMTAKSPEAPADKDALAKQNDTFANYITQDVKVYMPARHPGERYHEITRTMSEPSKQLVKALATTGEGSPESRAARLAYETTRGGKPRPEKLAIALDDPKMIAAINNPIFTKPDADPEEVKQAAKVRDELVARRDEMMKKFAEFRGVDKKIQDDPAKAREYTKNAVADMFGKDDEVGRELGTSMVEKGKANPAAAIKYAVRGWGTNEDLIRKTLKGMSAEEIRQMKDEYAAKYSGEGKNNPDQLYEDLGVFQNADTAKAAGLKKGVGGDFFTELSGDERQEVEELLLGEPKNDRDRMRLARMKYVAPEG